MIIEGLDRSAREYRIQETLIIYLASKGIHPISTRTKGNVTEAVMSDQIRKALVQIQGVLDELKNNLLVKNLKITLDNNKADAGKYEGRKVYKDATITTLLL